MPLTFDLTNIRNYEEVCYVWKKAPEGVTAEKASATGRRVQPRPDGLYWKVLNPVTEGIILITAPLNIGQITEENAAEFWTRLRILEKMNGPIFIHPKDGPKFTDAMTVEQHIGLYTNVTRKVEAMSTFLKRIITQGAAPGFREMYRHKIIEAKKGEAKV